MNLSLMLFRTYCVCKRIICIIIGLPLFALLMLFHQFAIIGLVIIGIPIVISYYIIDGTPVNYWIQYLHNWIVITEWITIAIAEYVFYGENTEYTKGPKIIKILQEKKLD